MKEIATIAKKVKSEFHATAKVNNSSANVDGRPQSALFPTNQQIEHHDSTDEDHIRINKNTLNIEDGPKSQKSGPRSAHSLRAHSHGNVIDEQLISSGSDEELDGPSQGYSEQPVRKRLVSSAAKQKLKPTGNTKYVGGDKIVPSNNCFAIFTSLLIIFPSGFAMTYTNYGLLGWLGGTLFLLIYLPSFINTLRILYLCSRTEPGIIPKLQSKLIDYNPNKQYRVAYKTPDQIMEEFNKQRS